MGPSPQLARAIEHTMRRTAHPRRTDAPPASGIGQHGFAVWTAASRSVIQARMKLLTFPRSLLFACFLLPACGDDKGDDSTATDSTAATPATPATPGTDATMEPVTDAGTDPAPTDPSTDPSGDPSTDPTATDPTVDPSATDPTADPTGDDGTFCVEKCAADADCSLGGTDLGYKCVDGFCAGGCADDNACVQMFSGWVTDCADQAGCPGQVCVDIGGGVGKCATAPSDFLMCETIMQSEIMLPPIEGGAEIAVCANTDYTCQDGQCVNPCEADADCMLFPGQNKCDTGTGLCVCADDAACMAFNADTPVCTANGFCGCGDDSNCAADPNYPTCTSNNFCGCMSDDNCVAAGTGDKCFNGSCGCSAAAACTGDTVFDGTMYACESF